MGLWSPVSWFESKPGSHLGQDKECASRLGVAPRRAKPAKIAKSFNGRAQNQKM
jgi:hypothetical protein